jgi:hypothetical protein
LFSSTSISETSRQKSEGRRFDNSVHSVEDAPRNRRLLSLRMPATMGTHFSIPKEKTTTMKTLGILLIVIGGIMTVFTGFNIITKKEVADIGPIEINKEEKTPIYWSPITGAILLVAGIIVVLVDKRK